jgi:hypothetical protein
VAHLEVFDYEEYKKNGFKVNKPGDFKIALKTKEDENYADTEENCRKEAKCERR